MQRSESIWTKKYVRWKANTKWRLTQTPIAAKMIWQHFKPTSVVDFGCAEGLYLKVFQGMGCRVVGVEGTDHWMPSLQNNIGNGALKEDLRIPFDLGDRFDMAMSVEVLEHLEEEYALVAVQNICRHSDLLFITASPKRGGTNHVNPQPKPYWIERFEAQGFEYREKLTEEMQLWPWPDRLRWLREDLMLFRRSDATVS